MFVSFLFVIWYFTFSSGWYEKVFFCILDTINYHMQNIITIDLAIIMYIGKILSSNTIWLFIRASSFHVVPILEILFEALIDQLPYAWWCYISFMNMKTDMLTTRTLMQWVAANLDISPKAKWLHTLFNLLDEMWKYLTAKGYKFLQRWFNFMYSM